MDKQKLIEHILKSDLTATEKRYLENVVNAEPIKHGKWLYWGRDSDHCRFYRCSLCKTVVCDYSESSDLNYQFCPYCGARMMNHIK